MRRLQVATSRLGAARNTGPNATLRATVRGRPFGRRGAPPGAASDAPDRRDARHVRRHAAAALDHLRRNALEQRVNTVAVLGAALGRLPPVGGAHLLRFLAANVALAVEIRLVGHDKHGEPVRAVDVGRGQVAAALHLLEPVVDAGEAVRVRHIVDDDGGLAAFEVARAQAAVPLLSGRVPNLQVDDGVVDRDRLRAEVAADRRFEVGGKRAFDELVDDARLPDGRLADDDNLHDGVRHRG
mmetsp:Transcript_11064/g.34249  ORF Transcript_11064/g.34249 Transcript_11064/m.34249 type:complete len:241 (-) Transcript_11064:37-759(-)